MSIDRPWVRPGAARYAVARVRAALRPPVTITEAPEELRKAVDVPVVTSDGVTLRINVYLPEGDGPFPVLLSAHPYGKDRLPKRTRRGFAPNFQYRMLKQSQPFEFSSETGWEAPDPVWWTQQGYAVINADLRGAGHSEGVGTLMSDQEAADIAQIIEWAATQSWSTGRVGMLGVSYLAISQYKVAALNPPHLAAICPWEGFTDAYRDLLSPGGVVENGFAKIWSMGTVRVARLTYDLGAERRHHLLRDQWWQDMVPDLEAIRMPMLVCTSFSDSNLHSIGSMRAFERAGSQHKHAYTHRGPKWATFYSDEGKAAQLAFFERYLRGDGANNDVEAGADAFAESTASPDVSAGSDALGAPAELPRLRLEIRESGDSIAEVRSEDTWPLPDTEWRPLRLGPHGALRSWHGHHELPSIDGSDRLELHRGALAWDFTFAEDTELTGPMSLSLWLSLRGVADAALFASAEKWAGGHCVPFEGSYGYGRDRVATGRQRVSLRELDSVASAPGRPVHTFSRREPVVDGEVVQVEIALSNSATVFAAGDRLRLVLAGRSTEPGNPLFGHFPARYERSGPGTATILWGESFPSALTVPVISRA